jgi:phosphoglucomutase
VVLTPSHNPPEDGGFKYNPPSGGPADVDVTGWIEQAANGFLEQGLADVRRIPYERARRAACVRRHDYLTTFVDDLANVVDLDRSARRVSPSGSIRSAARAFTIGRRSSSGTASPDGRE